MGKVFLLGIAIAIGYAIGYRDARQHSDHIVARAVDQVRQIFGAENGNDIDGRMERLEAKN